MAAVQETSSFTQPAAIVAVASSFVTISCLQVVHRNLQCGNEFLDRAVLCVRSTILVKPLASHAKTAIDAFAGGIVVVTRMAAIREVDVSSDKPARVLEQLRHIARDGSCAAAG